MEQLQSISLDSLEMSAPGDHRHFVSRGSELGGDVPADRAGAEYADSHTAYQHDFTSICKIARVGISPTVPNDPWS